MGRDVIEIEVIFLDVLAVISFVPANAKQALLEDRIAAVPEREGETQPLVVIADAGNAVLGPAIGAGAGVIVWKKLPRVSIGAVVFARIAPGSLRQIRSPASPVTVAVIGCFNAVSFGWHVGFVKLSFHREK